MIYVIVLLLIGFIIGYVVGIKLRKKVNKPQKKSESTLLTVEQCLISIQALKQQNEQLQQQLSATPSSHVEIEQQNVALQQKLDDSIVAYSKLEQQNKALQKELSAKKLLDIEMEKKVAVLQKKLHNMQELYKATEYAILNGTLLPLEMSKRYDELCPTVMLHLHSMDTKSLQQEFRLNDKQIQDTVTKFEARYTTKTIAAIYKLMAIAMRAELQNILYTLKYEKLENATTSVREMTAKYYAIATEGNQTIAGTLKDYISKIEYLFINAVKIEYNYYVKREQARAEQAALREQMRVEAAERKKLEEEQKKIEKEESKYQAEIDKITEALQTANQAEMEKMQTRIDELQEQLKSVADKKEEIIHLQNGKAGTVYIISNLGSFGESVFKIGMTRRMEPQERVDELGSASVPFRFDVHSFIFSDDAVGLETKLHQTLNEKRVNKVNRRKEFFSIPIDELQKLVYELDPTASFTTTMAAEEFRQSQSGQVFTSDYTEEDTDDE